MSHVLNTFPPRGLPYCFAIAENAFRGPLGKNGAADAPVFAEPGPGVSTNTNPLGSVNRDKTGERMVRKGCTVDYFGLRMTVLRVRKGMFWGKTFHGFVEPGHCKWVKVVA